MAFRLHLRIGLDTSCAYSAWTRTNPGFEHSIPAGAASARSALLGARRGFCRALQVFVALHGVLQSSFKLRKRGRKRVKCSARASIQVAAGMGHN